MDVFAGEGVSRAGWFWGGWVLREKCGRGPEGFEGKRSACPTGGGSGQVGCGALFWGAGGVAEFGGGGSGVGGDFGRGGTDYFLGDGGVEAGAVGFAEVVFDAAVFAGVEGQDGDPGSGSEAVGELC